MANATAQFIPEVWAAPKYQHVRRWRWWHRTFCASCTRADADFDRLYDRITYEPLDGGAQCPPQ